MIILAKHRLTDDEFLTRFADAAAKFLDMGLCNAEVKKMLANLEWVQDWLYQPTMMDYAAKLPKGYKWSQGERLGHEKSHGKRKPGRTGILYLDVDGDLYIRDIFTTWKLNPDGSVCRDPETNYRISESAIAVIRNWKQYLACEVMSECDRCWRHEREEMPTALTGTFAEYWKAHGGRINKTYEEPDDFPGFDIDHPSHSGNGGHRRYIMVQSPEPCNPNSDAAKAGYETVSQIGMERIRRAGAKIKSDTGADIDYGFRVFRLEDNSGDGGP